MVVEDLHAREEVVEVVRDELLERQVAHRVAVRGETSTKRGSIGGTLSRANSWRPVLALRMRMARFSDRPEMYGNGWAGSTASGISTGKTCAWKYSYSRARSSSSSVVPRDDLDAGLGQRGPHLRGPGIRVPQLQGVRVGGDVGEHLLRRAADVRRNGEAGDDAALQPRDAHHEELVEVAREDREEVRPLEDGKGRILGEFEHALIEGEPAQLAVEVAVVGQLRVEDLGQVEVVVVRVAESCVEHVVFDHPLIIAGGGDERVNRRASLGGSIARRCARAVRAS